MPKLMKSVTEVELSPTLAANEFALAQKKQSREILHMGFGQSPFPAHPILQQALSDNVHHVGYLPTGGLVPLREAAADYYQKKTGLNSEHFDTLIAPGSKLILYTLQMAIEGDVLLPVPSWVSYKPQALMLGQNPIYVPTTLNDDGYHITGKDLKTTIDNARKQGLNPTKIIINSPNNPTGLVIPDHCLKEIAEICVAEDILIISDEIYGMLRYDGAYESIARYAPTHTAVTTGLSKHVSLGGWRIGVGFIPKSVKGLFPLCCTLASELWSCVPAPIQYAAIEAYKQNEKIEQATHHYTAIHQLMHETIAAHLQSLGVLCPKSQGGFYCYPDFEPFRQGLRSLGIKTSDDLAAYLRDQYSLVTLPGSAFYEAPERMTLRLAGCDYDGEAALNAYVQGAALDRDFIRKYAPRLEKSLAAFTDFVERLSIAQKASKV